MLRRFQYHAPKAADAATKTIERGDYNRLIEGVKLEAGLTNGTLADHREARSIIWTLRDCARILAGVYERQCNGYLTPAHTWDEAAAMADERREKVAEARLALLARTFGLTIQTGGDPRGHALTLRTPKSGLHNLWSRAGGSGWGFQ